MSHSIGSGIAAGFIATLALSVLMVLKAMMGLMPDMNAIRMLAGMSHQILGTPATPVVGWLAHFLIGALIWGIAFALLHEYLGTSPIMRGVVFGTAAWLLMMVIVMPMAGAGLFGLALGIGAPIATLILHWIYGAVLGFAFDYLQPAPHTAH